MKAHKTTLSVRELQKTHRAVEKSENYGFHHCKAVGTDVGDDRLHERGCGLSRGEFL